MDRINPTLGTKLKKKATIAQNRTRSWPRIASQSPAAVAMTAPSTARATKNERMPIANRSQPGRHPWARAEGRQREAGHVLGAEQAVDQDESRQSQHDAGAEER